MAPGLKQIPSFAPAIGPAIEQERAAFYQRAGRASSSTERPMQIRNVMFAAFVAAVCAWPSLAADDDPHLWLSDIHGAKALAWVAGQNAKSEAVVTKDASYAPTREAILKSLDTQDRIPLGNLDHGDVYNFWQDAEHVRGLWRRTSVADYRNAAPNWEVLLDVDKLDADQHKQWVFHGAECSPSMKRCLVNLSPGGGDADAISEYDPKTHAMLGDGFSLKIAKSNATYLDDDTILFSTDFGPGTLTKSSYPRIVKLWHRGEPIENAKTIYEAKETDISASPRVWRGPYGAVAIVRRGITFFTSEDFAVLPDGSTLKLPLPVGAELRGVTGGALILTLRDDWMPQGAKKPFKKGSLVAFDVQKYVAMRKTPHFTLLYAPGKHATVENVVTGRDAVYASIFENITGSIHAFRRSGFDSWSDAKLDLPAGGSTAAVGADDWGPGAFFTYESFLVPPTLYEDAGDGKVAAIKSQSALFDASNMVSEQFWAKSKDGTPIPYFLIHRKDATSAVPTILYSYGGFELSLFPWYWNDGHRPLDAGQVWLSKGGAIAVANIRGGGEFGPAWHQATLKVHHQRAFDDFEAVGADLIQRGFTTPAHLGIVGASNGGLLVSATMTQRPDLFAAVVCQRPLIDMLRYTQFGAGASWVDEYGDPADPKMRAVIERYSPYQNVKPDVKMPSVLFITETSDDRVTPVFARMMAAKMEDQGHDVLFNEAAEGGHGPGSTNAEQADMWALSYVYFAQKLGLGK
jgi:prolyl oligopeptidase